MAAWQGFRFGFGVGLLVLLGAAAADAQVLPPPYPPGPPVAAAVAVPVPPPPPMASEAAQAAGCLCERQQIAALNSEMDAKKQALDQIRRELADLDAQLERARPTVDVNNPGSVETYKALLEHHDQAYQRSIGPIVSDAITATQRYNDRVSAYNQGCAHQLFDAAVMAQVRATLSCPAPR